MGVGRGSSVVYKLLRSTQLPVDVPFQFLGAHFGFGSCFHQNIHVLFVLVWHSFLKILIRKKEDKMKQSTLIPVVIMVQL